MLLFSGGQWSYIIKRATVVVVFHFGGLENLEALNFSPFCTTLFNNIFSVNCPCEEKERTKAEEN